MAIAQARQSFSRIPFRLWRRLSARAYPPGAVTFQLRVWARGRASSEERAVAAEIIRRFHLSSLWVAHGSALSSPAGGLVVTGPAGIGKSTVSRQLEQDAGAQLLEDGIVVIGVDQRGWHVIETGTLEVLQLTSKISKRVRTATLLDRSIYWEREGPRRAAMLWLFRHLVERPSYRLALLLAPRNDHFTPSLHPVRRVVVCRHPDAPCIWHHFDVDGEWTPVQAPPPVADSPVQLTVCSSLGSRTEVRTRLYHALLGDTAS